MTSVWEAGVRGAFRRWAAPVKSQAEQRTEKWHVFTVLWLRYSSKQYLEKVSLLLCRRLRQDRRRVGQEVTQQLVLALIMSRLDYCNSVLAGLYQRPRCSHYSASRMQLPDWCSAWVAPSTSRRPWSSCIGCRSATEYGSSCAASSTTSTTVAARRIWWKQFSQFGERAFSHAGPATWNALPDHIRTVADSVKFRKLLKSLYFSQAFNIWWLLCFSLCFSIWLTFVMHLWPRFS